MANVCTKCGVSLPEGGTICAKCWADSCLKCGAALPEGTQPPGLARGVCAKCQTVTNKLTAYAVGVIIFVALLVAWMIWKALH